MPKHKDLNRLIRARMDRTKEKYVVARARVIGEMPAGQAPAREAMPAGAPSSSNWMRVLDDYAKEKLPPATDSAYRSDLLPEEHAFGFREVEIPNHKAHYFMEPRGARAIVADLGMGRVAVKMAEIVGGGYSYLICQAGTYRPLFGERPVYNLRDLESRRTSVKSTLARILSVYPLVRNVEHKALQNGGEYTFQIGLLETVIKARITVRSPGGVECVASHYIDWPRAKGPRLVVEGRPAPVRHSPTPIRSDAELNGLQILLGRITQFYKMREREGTPAESWLEATSVFDEGASASAEGLR